MLSRIRSLLTITLAVLAAGAMSSCSSSDSVAPEGPTTGTIRIEVQPPEFSAPWSLSGPDGYQTDGTGDHTITGRATGSYNLTWSSVANWDLVGSANQQHDLAGGGTIVFSATYEPAVAALAFYEPDAGTTWVLGATDVPIRWVGGASGGLATLALHRSGAVVTTIADQIANTGEFLTWDVPSTLTPGSGYRLQIDVDGDVAWSAEFSIVAPGAIVISEPTTATRWRQGQENVPITWSGGDPATPVDIYLELFGTPRATIATGTPNDGSHTEWDVPSDLVTGPVQVRIEQSGTSVVSQVFFIDGGLQPLAVATPVAGTTWSRGQQDVLIMWTGGDPAQPVSIALLKGGTQVATIVASTENDGRFDTWDVPAGQTAGSDYQVRIQQGVEIATGEAFTISESSPLAVTEPTSGTNWQLGQQGVAIAWSGGDLTQTVDLLLYRGTLQVAVIATGVPNNGSYNSWDVPGSLALASDYRVQVVQGENDAFGENFSVVAAPLTLIEPNASAVWQKGQPVQITWSGGNPGQNIWIRLYANHGFELWGYVTASTENDGVYEWVVPETLESAYQYYHISIGQNSEWVNGEDFSIIGETIEVTTPNMSTIWSPGQTDVSIAWTGGDPSPETISLSLFQGSSRIETIASYIPNTGSHTTWDVPAGLTYGTDYRVEARQGANVAYSVEFQIGADPLQVTAPNGSSQWNAGTVHQVTWTGGNPSLPVTLYLYDGSVQVEVITSSTANDGIHNWFLRSTLTPGSAYRVQVAQNLDYDYGEYFEILPPLESLAVTEPTNATTWDPGQQNVTITWTGGDPNQPVDLFLFAPGWSDSTAIAPNTPNDGSHLTWDVPADLPDNVYRVQVRQGYHTGSSPYFAIGVPPSKSAGSAAVVPPERRGRR